jgi:hypothetical protein
MEPVCYALLFADRVITENNGKRGLIGVFGAFNFQSFPALSPPWFIYAGVTNLRGTHEFSLNLVRDDAQHVLLPIAGEINAERADRDSEFIFPIMNLVFQKPGVHFLTFNIDGTQMASRILRVNEYSPSGEQQ